jgi:hypothetical protein
MTFDEVYAQIWNFYRNASDWQWLDAQGTFRKAIICESRVENEDDLILLEAILTHAVRLEQDETRGLV